MDIHQLIGFGENIDIEYDAEVDEDCKGQIDCCGITVGANLTDNEKRATLLHEILHYCCNFTGHEIDEGAVEGIGNSLFALMVMNGSLFQWIIGGEDE